MNEYERSNFSPNAKFIQTCGHCGCIFRVELEWSRSNSDLQEYCCPECRHHPCRAKTPTPQGDLNLKTDRWFKIDLIAVPSVFDCEPNADGCRAASVSRMREDGFGYLRRNAVREMRERPLGAGLQEQASNHPKLHGPKVRVVSVRGKAQCDCVRYGLRRRAQANQF
jgi:hypothetical protein